MKKELNTKDRDQLIITLEKRFEKFAKRHSGIKWSVVLERLLKQPTQLYALHQMEVSGGEPDVVGQDKKSGAFLFYDCSAESPAGRRSSCYDEQALNSRKENKPKHSAMGLAEEMGVELLTEGTIHPTQKPVKLYKWLLANYAEPGWRILDTHLGSGSHAIAAHYAGVHLTACEIDADYFHAAKARIARETSQAELFSPQND